MAAKYDKPVMIHTSDSIGRFYPIGPKNERYEAGLWRRPGDISGNLYTNGPSTGDREGAREHAPQASENALRQRAHGDALLRSAEVVGVARQLPQRRRRDLGDGSGPRPCATAMARIHHQVSEPGAAGLRREPQPRAPKSSGSRTSDISRPTTSTSSTRRRFARPAGRQATAAGTSQESVCRTPCFARSTTRTPCATFRRSSRRIDKQLAARR